MSILRSLLLTAIFALAAFGFGQEAKSGAKTVILGRLGQTLEATPIKASPSSSSRTFYKVKPYEYVVLQGSKYTGWHRVLLQNGRSGYIKAQVVAALPYEVTADEQPAQRDPGSQSSRSAGSYVANRGLDYRGVRYRWGGTDPSSGIDCSAFVKMLYGEIGLKLPRTAAEQAMVGMPIRRLEDLQAGDRLYFWSSKRGKIGHTGVYMGNGWFVHSSSGKGQVSTDFLGKPNWMKILIAARR